MLTLRSVRTFFRYSTVAFAETYGTASNALMKKNLIEEPALVKLKCERDPEKLYNLFKANAKNRLIIENRFAFEDTISRLAGAKRFDYIEDLLEEQKSLPQGRREGFMVRIIMLYGKAGMVEHALNAFYDMHQSKRTAKSFNAALKVLTGTRNMAAIEAFLTEVPRKFEIELDLYSLNIATKAFCEMENLDKAFSVIVQMEKLGIRPDVITYTTLLSGLYRNNRFEIANGLWNLMVLKGCFPNLATFNVRIQYLVNRRQAWKANDLMLLMQKVGILPDEITYNLVIKGFFRAGYLEMAKRVYSALPGRRFKPNVKIYQTMVHYLCEGGELDMAYTMSTKCMKKNWFLSVDSICALLEALKKNGKLDKAKIIMALVRRKVPPFSSNQLSFFESILNSS
ncbi:Pentatricopeptide repeat-containing protein At1g80150, mitochondrial [Linum grandiflorum]